MRGRIVTTFLLASTLISGAFGSDVSAARSTSSRETYIVVFKNGIDPSTEASRLKGEGYDVRFTYQHLFPGVAVNLPPQAVAGFERNPNVEMIEKDGVVTINDTQSNATWGLDRIDQTSLPLDKSYSYPSNAGQGVTAYIIDTGILTSHVEFTGRTGTGYTAIADGRGTRDCNGHGTHVAGTVAGSVYGVAKKARVVPVRVLDCRGSGTWSSVIAGMDWVTANAVRPAVANLSLGGGASSSVDFAVQKMIDKGVTVVVAAGNETADACNSSPARAAAAITVGATTSSDAQATYSNFGTCVDIFAPGSSITSAWHTSTTTTNTISGTSMASPHVAGVAARILAANPTMLPAAVTSAITGAASAGKVASMTGTGSPNLLLYAAPPVPPTPITIGTTALTSGTQYIAYSQSLSASGGDGTNYSWSAAGLPAGLTVSGSSITGTPTASGSFPITLTVKSGGLEASSALLLDIAPGATPPPSAFTLRSPANGATKISLQPALSWNASTGASSYQVCVTTNSAGCAADSTAWRTASSTSLTWTTTLSSRTRHYWHVRAVNSSGTTSSAVWSFVTRS